MAINVSYKDLLVNIVGMLDNNTHNFNKLASCIFDGLDMFNDVLNDDGCDLSGSKEAGIELIKAVMPNVREEELDTIKRLLTTIFVNANRKLMGSRVIQYEQSSESRLSYMERDKEKNFIGTKKCQNYFYQLISALINSTVFPIDLTDLDEELATLVIEQPDFVYIMSGLLEGFKKHQDITLDSTKREILFGQRLLSNKIALEYLRNNLEFLLTKANLNTNTRAKLELMIEFWKHNSSWCYKYEVYDDHSDNLAHNPDIRVHDWLVSIHEPNKAKYEGLQSVLNRIMAQTSTLSEESIKKLIDSDFLEKVQLTKKQAQVIRKLISAKVF